MAAGQSILTWSSGASGLAWSATLMAFADARQVRVELVALAALVGA
jgi:hypothetical protein